MRTAQEKKGKKLNAKRRRGSTVTGLLPGQVSKALHVGGESQGLGKQNVATKSFKKRKGKASLTLEIENRVERGPGGLGGKGVKKTLGNGRQELRKGKAHRI